MGRHNDCFGFFDYTSNACTSCKANSFCQESSEIKRSMGNSDLYDKRVKKVCKDPYKDKVHYLVERSEYIEKPRRKRCEDIYYHDY